MEASMMTPSIRKFALTAHVTSSVGLLGAVAAFLALAVMGLTSQEPPIVRAVYIALNVIVWHVIVPLCFAALLTGMIQGLGTPWGLFRHYWVLAKLVLTAFTLVVVLVQTATINQLARAAAATLYLADLRLMRIQVVVHAAGGLLVLLVTTALSVYKPRGMTRYGLQKEREARALSRS
jgi:hypothetical protein